MHARILHTFIIIDLTVDPEVAWCTDALVPTIPVDTPSAIFTRQTKALVHITLTSSSGKSICAIADERGFLILACSIMEAGGREAVVYIKLTESPFGSDRTLANKAVYPIDTCTVLLAGRTGTFIYFGFAILATVT